MVFTFEEGIEKLKKILVNEDTPILFLGAGFSYGAINKANAMGAKDLKKYIYDKYIVDNIEDDDKEEVKLYNLRKLCDEVYNIHKGNKKKLYNTLKSLYENTQPAEFHTKLTSYPWKEIYTVNVDDLIENIYLKKEINLQVQNKKEIETVNEDIQLYKLHGCVNNLENGLIFSDSEYRTLITSSLDAKLNHFVGEIQRKNTIMLGASFDEPDILFYLQKYEDAGCKYRNNELIIIDYNPSRSLRTLAEKLNATLIKGSAEDFLNYLSKLNYNPGKLEKARIDLNYNGIYMLNNIEQLYINPYESKLYEGYFCQWQDVHDEWTFNTNNLTLAQNKLDNLINRKNNIKCFSIYGKYFSGKSCLLKQLAYYLKTKGYDVFEYKGRFLNTNSIINYIRMHDGAKVCLVIDNASYYYEQIEKIFAENIGNNELLVLTASRIYYHLKKKYYLEGNTYYEYRMKNEFVRMESKLIRDTLREKKFLSYMASYSEDEQNQEIYRCNTIANLIVKLTYGNINRRQNRYIEKSFEKMSFLERRLIIELAVFDMVDIEVYPRELFVNRYGRNIILDEDIISSVTKIVDYVRMDINELSLRNSIVEKYVLSNFKHDIPDIMIELLKYVSRYVTETKNDIWYIIFQGLLKEDILTKRLKLDSISIKKIYFSLKEEYGKISYYWLQLGLYMQNIGDFISAYNYLEISSSIRPKSYKIQHALARNYMRYANNTSNYKLARELFDEGEKRIMALIDSKDYYKEKAKPFSITSYVLEKIKFANKFDECPTHEELMKIFNLIESLDNDEKYMEKMRYAFYTILEKYDKLNSILKINFDSPYFKYVGRRNILTESDLDYESRAEDL